MKDSDLLLRKFKGLISWLYSRRVEFVADFNLNSQDIVLEEVAKASVLVEARHQPELNLVDFY